MLFSIFVSKHLVRFQLSTVFLSFSDPAAFACPFWIHNTTNTVRISRPSLTCVSSKYWMFLNIAIFHFQTEWLWIFKGKGEGSSIRKVLLFWKVKSNSAEFVKHGFWIAVDIQSKTCWKTAGNAKTAKSALLPQNNRSQSSGNVKSENYYFKHKFAFFPGGQYHQDLLIYWTFSHDNDNHY